MGTKKSNLGMEITMSQEILSLAIGKYFIIEFYEYQQ